jgi:hypothetical protein
MNVYGNVSKGDKFRLESPNDQPFGVDPPYRDVVGNGCSRIIAATGRIRLWAMVELTD